MTGRLVRHGTRSDNADAACGLRGASRRPASSGRQLGVVFLEKLFLGHVPFGDLGKLDDEKTKLIARVRRIRGQVEAVERALESETECTDVLRLIASVRGAVNGLMGEVMEDHVLEHIVGAANACAGAPSAAAPIKLRLRRRKKSRLLRGKETRKDRCRRVCTNRV